LTVAHGSAGHDRSMKMVASEPWQRRLADGL
jgi:hypothetical protein